MTLVKLKCLKILKRVSASLLSNCNLSFYHPTMDVNNFQQNFSWYSTVWGKIIFWPETKGDYSLVHLHTPHSTFLKSRRNRMDLETWIHVLHLLWDNHMVGGLQVIELLQIRVIFLGKCIWQYPFNFTEMSWNFMKGTEAENSTWWKTYYVPGCLMCFACIIWFMLLQHAYI